MQNSVQIRQKTLDINVFCDELHSNWFESKSIKRLKKTKTERSKVYFNEFVSIDSSLSESGRPFKTICRVLYLYPFQITKLTQYIHIHIHIHVWNSAEITARFDGTKIALDKRTNCMRFTQRCDIPTCIERIINRRKNSLEMDWIHMKNKEICSLSNEMMNETRVRLLLSEYRHKCLKGVNKNGTQIHFDLILLMVYSDGIPRTHRRHTFWIHFY